MATTQDPDLNFQMGKSSIEHGDEHGKQPRGDEHGSDCRVGQEQSEWSVRCNSKRGLPDRQPRAALPAPAMAMPRRSVRRPRAPVGSAGGNSGGQCRLAAVTESHTPCRANMHVFSRYYNLIPIPRSSPSPTNRSSDFSGLASHPLELSCSCYPDLPGG